MANATSFLKPSTMVVPLQFSDLGRIDFRFLRYSTDVYHTLWCYIVDKNGDHIQDEQHNDIRILLANEDNINWDVPSSFPNYRFSLPETAAELFDFSTPDNCYVDFAIFTYSSSTYSGSSIVGTEWFSDYSEIVKVQPSAKMYPQIRLIITDETKAYKNTGGKYFYLDNDASQTDLSSNGNIKVEINYYSSRHEPEPGAVSQDFCQINGQQAPAVFTNNGLNYNRNTTISGTSIINAESKTNFRISVIDGQGLSSEYTTSITWANSIPATKFNDLKELSEDDLRYDYRLGTPVPTSLYLAPDWTATEYTTAPVPDDWEYYADIGDNGTGLINQRDILNDQKRQLNLQLFRKYYRYIQEGTWLDDSYIDDNLYYLDANKILNQSSYPKATYTIDVVDINGIKKYAAYEFTLGQRTYVEDPDMFGYVYNTVAGGKVKTPFRKEVIISERSRNLDDPSKSTIKVQTYKNQWEDIFSSLTATTQSLQYASGGYARAANAVNPNGSINVHSLEQTFQQGDFALSGSATQSITWDGSYGIEIADMSNSLIKLRIASNGLAITTDGGATWNNAITGNGINTNYLLAGQIDASKINIISKEGDYAFNWNEKGLNAVLPLQEGDDPDDAGNSYVRFNDLGIYGTIEGADIDDWEESNEDASIAERIAYIKEHSTFFLGWEGLTLREIDGNVINLNPNVGLEIFNNDTYEPPATSPWLWDNTKLNGTNFNKDPNGTPYQVGEKIPVLTLGEFYNGALGENSYGLLTRNQSGAPTLYTDEEGNLVLSGDMYHPENNWHIYPTGYAEFQNAKVRGTLSTVVFERDKLSMIGGDVVISPTVYIEEDKNFLATGPQGTWVCEIDDPNISDYYTSGDIALVYIAEAEETSDFEGSYYAGRIIYSGSSSNKWYLQQFPLESYFSNINLLYSVNVSSWPTGNDRIQTLTKGSNIVRANLNTNVIRLTANQKQGGSIIVEDASGKHTTKMGYLYFDTIPQDENTELKTLVNNNGAGSYGFYGDNVFLAGTIYAKDGRFSGTINSTKIDATNINFGNIENRNYIQGTVTDNLQDPYNLIISADTIYLANSSNDTPLDIREKFTTIDSLDDIMQNNIAGNTASINALQIDLARIYNHLSLTDNGGNFILRCEENKIEIQNQGLSSPNKVVTAWTQDQMTTTNGIFLRSIGIGRPEGFGFVLQDNGNLRLEV